jgi:predicted aspartyl protease
MSWFHVMSALAVAAVGATTIKPADTANPIDPAQADQIVLTKEQYERVTVPVTIKGQGPFRFMVDTGAQATVVSSQLADQLGLDDRSSAVLVGIASKAAVETAMIPEFELGSRSFYIRTAPIVPQENLGGADGILGLDSLQGQRVLIDFHKQRIYVADAKELGGNSGYEIVVKARRRLGQLIITGARLNGVDTNVIIDTGSQGSIGNLALLERLRRTHSLGDNTMTDVNGKTLTAAVRVGRKLEIDNMQMNNIPIMFADAPPFEALNLVKDPALILGINELKMFRRVAIDFSNQRVLFDLPRGTRRQDAMIGAIIS